MYINLKLIAFLQEYCPHSVSCINVNMCRERPKLVEVREAEAESCPARVLARGEVSAVDGKKERPSLSYLLSIFTPARVTSDSQTV